MAMIYVNGCCGGDDNSHRAETLCYDILPFQGIGEVNPKSCLV